MMFDPTPQSSPPDSERGQCGGGLTPPDGRRPGPYLTNDQRKPDRNGWNPPDGRVTGSAGGGQERSCMAVAAPVAIGIGTLAALLVRRVR